jgi:hypothetical protein
VLLAGEALRLYQTYTVPEVADILDAPLDAVQAALRDYGVLTPRNAAGLVRQGWTVADVAREWGLNVGQVKWMLRRGR